MSAPEASRLGEAEPSRSGIRDDLQATRWNGGHHEDQVVRSEAVQPRAHEHGDHLRTGLQPLVVLALCLISDEESGVTLIRIAA